MNCSQCGYELAETPFGNYVCPNNAIHAREDTKAILAHQLSELVEEFGVSNDMYDPAAFADFARLLKEYK